MGRGRQKAKQTKVARELKYSTSDIDVTALQRELSSSTGSFPPLRHSPVDPEEDEDEYDSYSRAR